MKDTIILIASIIIILRTIGDMGVYFKTLKISKPLRLSRMYKMDYWADEEYWDSDILGTLPKHWAEKRFIQKKLFIFKWSFVYGTDSILYYTDEYPTPYGLAYSAIDFQGCSKEQFYEHILKHKLLKHI